jgi:Tol biopolymer transport system component
MIKKYWFFMVWFFLLIFLVIWTPARQSKPGTIRSDGALLVNISKTGSQQNPAWSPDCKFLLFTRFRGGYNKEPADLFIVNLETNVIRTLVSDGSGNINLPGSVWNPVSNRIVFASTRDPHDEIYIIDENGVTGDEIQVTSRKNYVAYEPSFSPGGEWIVFESHLLDVEGNGVIYKCKSNGEKPYQMLTGGNDDCRQPNWSPTGDRILYQKRSGARWDIWVMNTDGTGHEKITGGSGDKTDASFSPDGQWIVYSSDEGGEAFANLYIKPVNGGDSIKITHYEAGYDGAPSWSPGGDRIAFESYPGDPDDSSGTSIWIIDLQLQLPVISLDRTRLNFGFPANSSVPISQTFGISSNGSGAVEWQISISTDAHWLSCTPAAGTGSGIITVIVNPSGLSSGQHNGTVTVSASNAANSPQVVSVVVHVYAPGSADVPFGEFSTPVDGSTVMSSIPVTGWVLDDIGVESVKIYRDGEPGLVYIGEAVFVEGARPDVEGAYPDYPFNYKAGWGYMMLTNFLPNSGNGTFNIHAIAADMEGNQVNLGTKTITCDNAHAVKPFGALDTPSQGGIASGSSFVNWGWVLTPLPNRIPTDGSFIRVWVDGVSLGNPVYNLYREDIALLFPGYHNSSGAGGYFYLDTAQYANGVHTLQWTATDYADNTDGIGSRYFTIQNRGSDARVMEMGPRGLPPCPDPHEEAQSDHTVRILKGYSNEDQSQLIYPDENGVITVKINELERVEIHISWGTRGLAPLSNCSISSTNQWQGFQVIGGRPGALPIGSTLDREKGIFYWQPGPGFVGEYRLVFIKKDRHENVTRKNILVEIIPLCIMKPEHLGGLKKLSAQ